MRRLPRPAPRPRRYVPCPPRPARPRSHRRQVSPTPGPTQAAGSIRSGPAAAPDVPGHLGRRRQRARRNPELSQQASALGRPHRAPATNPAATACHRSARGSRAVSFLAQASRAQSRAPSAQLATRRAARRRPAACGDRGLNPRSDPDRRAGCRAPMPPDVLPPLPSQARPTDSAATATDQTDPRSRGRYRRCSPWARRPWLEPEAATGGRARARARILAGWARRSTGPATPAGQLRRSPTPATAAGGGPTNPGKTVAKVSDA